MKLSDIKINMSQFYLTGIVCFAIIGVMNLTNFFIFYEINNVFGRISSFFGVVFNFALVLFFNYLRGMSGDPEYSEEYASEDINQIIKDISKGKKKNVKKK